MTAKGLHKHEGYNFCDWCHESFYEQREYGPGPGGETIEERRAREQRELEERERRLREIEEMRNRKVSCDPRIANTHLVYFSLRMTRG